MLAAASPCCALRSAIKATGANADQAAGINIVRRALQAPARQIAANAGAEASIVVGKILENKGATYGYNAQTGEYGDMIAMGIVDPVKVVRTALQDAASVAGLLVTTEAMIAEAPKKDAGGGMPGMPAAAWAAWAAWTSNPANHARLRKGRQRCRPFSWATFCRSGQKPGQCRTSAGVTFNLKSRNRCNRLFLRSSGRKPTPWTHASDGGLRALPRFAGQHGRLDQRRDLVGHGQQRGAITGGARNHHQAFQRGFDQQCQGMRTAFGYACPDEGLTQQADPLLERRAAQFGQFRHVAGASSTTGAIGQPSVNSLSSSMRATDW